MIREFFNGRTILITGGTGFIGQGLIAKILRELPGVERLWLLIRPKKQPDGRSITAAERLRDELFGREVFARFKREDPQGFAQACRKVSAVEGDLLAPRLGLDEKVRTRLLAEVDLVVAIAATVVFDEPLDRALQLNTEGPLELLRFAGQCRREAPLIHVSTAYVSGRRCGSILEEPLPLDRTAAQLMAGRPPEQPFDPEAEIAACREYCRQLSAQLESEAQQALFRREILAQHANRRLSENRLAKLIDDRGKRWLERRLVDEGMRRAKAYGWNDVYTFTKAMGEQLLVKHRGRLPLVIVRPSIVESSLTDPEPGWVFGLKVAEPMIIAYARGLLADFPAGREVVMDLVPVDLVVNVTLAAATQATGDQVRVFHAATGAENPLTMGQMYEYVRGYFQAHPLMGRNGQLPRLPEWSFPSARRFRWGVLWRYLYPLQAAQWIIDRLPDRLPPGAWKRRLAGLEKRLRRVLYYTELFSPYTSLDCRFEFHRSQALFEALPAAEQRLFPMDVKAIDWRSYFQEVHLPGLRRFVLKEEGFEEAGLRESPEEPGVEEERWQGEESIRTLPDLLRWTSVRYGSRIALQTAAGAPARHYTYAQVQAAADRLAQGWQQQGLQPEDRVLLSAANSPEWAIAFLGASILGLTVIPVDPQTRPAELWALAEYTGARALLASVAFFERLPLPEVAARREAGLGFFNLEDCGRSFGRSNDQPALPPETDWKPPVVEPQQTASIFFTCGPPATPRGAMLTHQNWLAALLGWAEVHPLYETDRLLSLMPLHYGPGFIGGLLMPLLGGATVTYLNALNSRDILQGLGAAQATVLLSAPRLLKILGDRLHRLEGPASAELHLLRLAISGGAPLPPETLALYQRLGIPVCEAYGLTEAGGLAAVNPPDGVRPGSVGQALPGVEICLDDPENRGSGEILVRGPQVMAGYLDQPELTEKALAGGWLHTGDLGRRDADGYLYITGRLKSALVTTAGRSVYPEEVEALYGKLPQVAELAVVGVPAAHLGSETVHGVAVLERGGATDEEQETLGEAVREQVRQLSAAIPGALRIQQLHLSHRPLPRLDNGQVDRAALLATLQQKRQPADPERIPAPLPAWEQEVYRYLGQLTGLPAEEVDRHAEAPLDTLLDSLMAIEFTALLEAHLEVALPPLDRSRDTLRALLERLAPDLAGKLEQLQRIGPSAAYWSAELVADQTAAANGTLPAAGKRPLQRLVWPLGGTLLSRYFSLQTHGLEHLPQDRPYLLAANHASHLDTLVVLAAVRPYVEQCRLMAAKDYFFGSRLRRWMMHHLAQAAPFDRYGNFRETLLKARSLVGVRSPLLIFPEGTRSASGQLQPFKLGIGLLAFELDVPIVPVHIRGAYEALPRGGRRPERRPIRLRLGAPLEMAPFRRQSPSLSNYEIYRQIVEALHRRIENLAVSNS